MTQTTSSLGYIYHITNTKNGKIYIGSTISKGNNRWNHHKHHLRRGTHYNSHLQRAWNKYGEFCFTYHVVESAPINQLRSREEDLIQEGQTFLRKIGYNLSRECRVPNKGSSNGMAKYDEETILALKEELSLGSSDKDAASKFGMDRRYVCGIRNLQLWSHVAPHLNSALTKMKRPPLSGTSIGTSKLEENDVLRIREMWDTQIMSQSAIAREYGVTPKCINLIVNRINWKHL